MLSRKDFKEADKETLRIMLLVAEQEKKGYLDGEDIKKIPCRDLRTIDELWFASSDGKFGFSVQKQIWIDCGIGDWRSFNKRVGWLYDNEVIQFWALCRNGRDVMGHLPYSVLLSHYSYKEYMNNMNRKTLYSSSWFIYDCCAFFSISYFLIFSIKFASVLGFKFGLLLLFTYAVWRMLWISFCHHREIRRIKKEVQERNRNDKLRYALFSRTGACKL